MPAVLTVDDGVVPATSCATRDACSPEWAGLAAATGSAPAPAPAPADVLLADGSVAVIRPMCAADEAGLVELHEKASEESIRLRFFAFSHVAGRRYIQRILHEPSDRSLALVAETNGGIVGLATAEVLDATTAEIALLVADPEHGRGLGTLLVEHLAALARHRGLTTFVAEVLAENTAMLHVLRDTGFTEALRTDTGVVYVELDVTASADAVLAADRREFRSEARSLHPLLYPRSVAVAGAGPASDGVGRAVVAAIRTGGFTGSLCAVDPAGTEVPGLRTYRELGDAPEQVDLLVVATAPERVLDAVRDAAQAGVPSVVVVSQGPAQLRTLVRLARRHSVRLVGPHSLGVMCNHRSVRLNATFARALPPYGGLAVASQSGGVGIVLLDLAERRHLGVHSLVSLGDKADVSSNDLLSAWIDDPHVTAAALYLESFGNARKFARVARRFSERKPIVAVLGGRSSPARDGGPPETPAPAATSLAVQAVFAHAGVIVCDTAEELIEAALLLSGEPLPRGRRVAVVGNAGGLETLAADLVHEEGLTVPRLSPALRADLRALAAGSGSVANPVDLGPACDPAALAACVDRLLGSDEVDSLLVTLVATRLTDSRALVDAVVTGRDGHRLQPVVLVGSGPVGSTAVVPGVTAPGVTTLGSVAGAARALRQVTAYAEWRATPHEEPAGVDGPRARASRAAARLALSEAADASGWAPRRVAVDLLARYGLGRLAEGPVPPHAARPESVLDGVELELGIVHDGAIGPVLTAAAGGTAGDPRRDRTFLIPPVSRADAERALRTLRVWPVLTGTRGRPPADVTAVVDVMERLGQLAVEVPDVARLSLEPVVVGVGGLSCGDVKLRLAKAPAVDAGVPRKLRDPV